MVHFADLFSLHRVLDVQRGVLPCSQNCQRGEMLIDRSDKRTI